MNFADVGQSPNILTSVNSLLLGRPPWLTRNFNSFITCFLSIIYAICFALYVVSSALKVKQEYSLCGVNSIHYVTLGHDVFSSFCVCYFVLYSYAKQEDQSEQICADFRMKSVKSLFRAVMMFAPALSVLFLNLYWQTEAFSSVPDLIEAISYHIFSTLIWNGLWIYTCVRIHMVYYSLQQFDIDAKLNTIEKLNNEIGKYLLLLFAKSVFDAISSLSFYSVQEAPLPHVLLLHETGVILYDLIFCACVAELSSRISEHVRCDFLNRASFITKVSGSIPWSPSLQTALVPRGLDAFGVFTVNRSFLATMCGTTLTFLLILVQLSPDVQNKMRVEQIT